ncbi:MAG: DUF1697 domain-containing protein [Actinomycetes bacterium]
MTRWVALLRGVNVGSARRVSMPDLRARLAERGADDVATYVQSGNVVLSSAGEADSVGRLVRDAVADLGVGCDVVVRSGAEMADVVGRNPWPDRVGEPTKLNVGFLDGPTAGEARRVADEEEVRFDGRELWLWYGAGQGRSKLVLDVGQRVLTVRNWRTVLALAEMSA